MGIEESGVLLIHSDGPDGSTTFVDSSGQGHNVLTAGAVHHEEDAAKFGSTAIHGDGSGDYLRIYSSDDFKFGTGDFTVDFWFNCDSPWWSGLFTLDDSTRFLLSAYGNNGDINVYVNSTIYSTAISPATWYHLAIVRYGNTVTLYLNGSSFATKDVTGVSFDIGTYDWVNVGRHYNDLSALEGYIDEFRIVKGIAEWTSNFTPHTVPYEDGSTDVEVDSPEISLTTSFSSVSQISIVQPEPQASLQLSTDIGLYIASPESQIDVLSSLGSVYIGRIITTPELLLSLTPSSDSIILIPSGVIDNTVSVTTVPSLLLISPEAVVNISSISDDPAAEVFTGSRIQSPEIILSPLVSSIIKVDHADFGIQQLGVLLIHSDGPDGSVIFEDSSGRDHEVIPWDDTYHEADKRKFDSTSIRFYSFTDFLSVPTSDDFNFGTGDFTVDFWFNTDDFVFYEPAGISGGLFSLRGFYDSNLLRVSLRKQALQVAINGVTLSIPISVTTWHHVAVVRKDNIATAYLDGTSFGSTDVTDVLFDDDGEGLWIGRSLVSEFHFYGYMDEFRIVKGIAAWTEDFTPFDEAYFIWDGTVKSSEIPLLLSNDSDVQLGVGSTEPSVDLSHSVDMFTGVLIISDEALLTPSASSDLQLGISQPEIQAVITHDSGVQLRLLAPESQVVISPTPSALHIGIPIFTPEAALSLTASSDASLLIGSPEIINTVNITTNPSILFASIEAIVNTAITTADPPVVTFTTEHADVYYLLTLTGEADGTTDIEIPMKSFQGRLRSGDPSYLSVVIPGIAYSSEITARSNGELVVDMAYKLEGAFVQREEIARVTLEDIRIDQGSINQSISLSGHKTESYSEKAVTITQSPTYYNLTAGKIRYRFPTANMNLNPGDTLTVGTDVFTAGLISYTVGVASQQMEVAEA